jgi:tetratricopeptide (TPR) repeat protein
MRIHAVPQDGTVQVFPEDTLRQLAIAQMLLYLKTSDPEYLKKAVNTMNSESLKAGLRLPETAFWYYYIKAHDDMEKGNAEGFVEDIFHIWLDVILKLESANHENSVDLSVSEPQGFYRSTSYLYRNLANLILQRAIVRQNLSDVDALGVIIRNLSSRMPPEGYGKWVEQVCQRMSGPESDNFHLGFTVRFMEAEKKRIALENAFESGKNSSIIEQHLVDCLAHYGMLFDMAKTRHGKATAVKRQLQLSSFVLSRLYIKGSNQAVLKQIPIPNRGKDTSRHEDNLALEKAIGIFDELAQISRDSNTLVKNGFLSQEQYLTAMQANIPLIEKMLIRYLEYFALYVNNGYRNIVPDNAYFGAVEAAELLSDIHFLSAQWEKGLKKYDMALARRVQALEIFPFDVTGYYIAARRLTELGRLEQYKQYIAIQADRIRNSNLIKAYAVPENKYPGNDMIRLRTAVPEIIMRAPYGIVLQPGLLQVPKELSRRLTFIEKEIGARSKNDPLDVRFPKRITELTQQLKQRLSKNGMHTREDILAMIQDIDPIIAVIEENQKSQPQSATDEELPLAVDLFPGGLYQSAMELKQIKEECILLGQLPDMKELRDRLVADVNHPFHTLIRKLYHENSPQDFLYPKLLRMGAKPSQK